MNKLALYNVISLTLYFIIGYFVALNIVPVVGGKPLFLGVFASWLLLMIGVQIVHFKFKEGQFVNRFMMATTVQVLGFLALAVYLNQTQTHHRKELLLSVVFIHMLALAIQSGFFLRQGNAVR
jgi:predicted MFS family arabinose efflux permease